MYSHARLRSQLCVLPVANVPMIWQIATIAQVINVLPSEFFFAWYVVGRRMDSDVLEIFM